MREILFKAKRTDNGEWVEGSLIVYPDGDSYICGDCDEPYTLNKYKVDPETVCQYTGLTDMKGQKIWENDIVSITWHDIKEDKCIKRIVARVIFEDGSFRFDLGRYGHVPIGDRYFNYALYERVGSYIDNPELLEVE